jgi:putative phage-type endonuclease
MRTENCLQGTKEWFDARSGRVTASHINEIMAYSSNGAPTEKRITYRTQLIAEMLTGLTTDHFVSEAMKWGIAQEALAATEYELGTDEDVRTVGFVYHPTIERAGASPDRMVGTDGLLEVKCPNTSTHLKWILDGSVPEQHRGQMYFQMRCCERKWCDFMSFDSRLPRRYQKFIRRLYADEVRMSAIDDEVRKILAEADEIVSALDKVMPPVQQDEPPADRTGEISDEDIAWARENIK